MSRVRLSMAEGDATAASCSRRVWYMRDMWVILVSTFTWYCCRCHHLQSKTCFLKSTSSRLSWPGRKLGIEHTIEFALSSSVFWFDPTLGGQLACDSDSDNPVPVCCRLQTSCCATQAIQIILKLLLAHLLKWLVLCLKLTQISPRGSRRKWGVN